MIMDTKDIELAPLVVFAYNRADVLFDALESLKKNKLAEQTNLFIFLDGPKSESDVDKVQKVLEVANDCDGFKTIQIIRSEKNKGLAKSVISGVSKIFEKYDSVIVVEDDLYVAPCFLEYMNLMLNTYKKDNRIFQVSGFGTKIDSSINYDEDIYMNHRAQCWSWGTWKDRWISIDWEVKDYNNLLKDKKKQRAFNKGGSDLFGMLKDYMEHRNNSWFIRFAYSMFQQKKFTICPIKSLVRNDGFGNNATHCKNTYNRYNIDFNNNQDYKFRIPKIIEWNKHLCMNAIRFWSIRYRIYGKIMLLKQKALNISASNKS